MFVIITLHNDNNRNGEKFLFHYLRVNVMKWFFLNYVINIIIAMLNYLLNIVYFCRTVTEKFKFEDYSVTWMSEWMSEQTTNKRTNERTNERASDRANERTNEQTNERTHVRPHDRTHARTHECMNAWMNKWINALLCRLPPRKSKTWFCMYGFFLLRVSINLVALLILLFIMYVVALICWCF